MADELTELDRVRELEQAMRSLPQVMLDTQHMLHGRMYARTVFIPAGTVLTGALTDRDNICIVNGDITVTTDHGVMRLTGYHLLPAIQGYKRVGYAHGDTYWTTLIHTDAATVSEAEEDLTSEPEVLQSRSEEHQRISSFRQDYSSFVLECGLNEEQVQAIVVDVSDQVVTLDCLKKVYADNSQLHGLGLFSLFNLQSGETIAPGQRHGKRCLAGRYVNHSPIPNSRFVVVENGLDLVAIEPIERGTEITVNYREAFALTNTLRGT